MTAGRPPTPTMLGVAQARFGAVQAHGVEDIAHDPDALTSGFWAVVVTFEGDLTAVRMRRLPDGGAPEPPPHRGWPGLGGGWRSTMDEAAYVAGVEEIRRRIAAGTVYQVNLCRVLEHDLPDGLSVSALGEVLARGNPAPHAATIDVPEAGLEVVCASPEAYLLRRGDRLLSGPIKGTAPTAAGLRQKDYAENVMIVDLVRHDLAHVCRPGTVAVEGLCRLEEHPGLVHLVSEVSGRLRTGVDWGQILAATFPPGSVSGAPKHTALQAIADLEPGPRGPYCGAVGWIDADRGEAALAVGIRSFWATRRDDGRRVLRFGTGAGITWGSSAVEEWRETELKAARLVGLATAGDDASGRL